MKYVFSLTGLDIELGIGKTLLLYSCCRQTSFNLDSLGGCRLCQISHACVALNQPVYLPAACFLIWFVMLWNVDRDYVS
jgi:hypothetical protein